MKNSLVSIVVPVYNGEKHIKNCVQSLLEQTYENIELLIVNDGSRDNTELVLKDIQKADARIRIINQENQGVSCARNTGIINAHGKYLLFLDSDDLLEKNAIELLMNNNEEGTDLIIYGFKVNGNGNRKNDTEVLKSLKQCDADKNKILGTVLSTKNSLYGYAWRSAYSVNFLKSKDIFFPDGIKISEDYYFFVKSIYYADKISIVDKELYDYQLGESSMSIKYIPSLLHDMNYVNEWIYENIVKNNKAFLNGYNCMVANTYLRFAQNSFRDRERSFIKICLDVIKHKRKFKYINYIKKIWSNRSNFDLKSQISVILFRFHLDFIYFVLFKLKVMIKE